MLAQQVTPITDAHGLNAIAQEVNYAKDTEKISEILKHAYVAASNGAWSIEYSVWLRDYQAYYRILTSRGFSMEHVKGSSFNQLRETLGSDGVAVYRISWSC